MLKEKIEQMVANQEPLFQFEKEYAVRQGFLGENTAVSDKEWSFPVIERCLKETEEVIKVEHETFLEQPVSYFSTHIEEFLYVESNIFETVGVDGIAFETDDVFGTSTVLFGLKAQKKMGAFLKEYFTKHVGTKAFSAMFSDQDGLWDVNIPLDHLEGFHKEMQLKEAFNLAYRFIFDLLVELEAVK